MNTRKTGDIYENKACEYLTSLGYEIVTRNFRGKRGEIDIIAKDGEYLVFAEVKYRESNDNGFPEESVTKSKQATIYGVARYFLLTNNYKESTPCRFDVIAYYYDGSLKHYKNAFGGM